MAIGSKMDIYVVPYSHHRMHRDENECSTTMLNNIEGSSKHDVKQKKETHKKPHTVLFHLYNI